MTNLSLASSTVAARKSCRKKAEKFAGGWGRGFLKGSGSFRFSQMFRRINVIVHAWGHYECASLAAGVAFYAALSIFPVMMVLVAGVGYFFRFMPDGASARDEILELLSRQMSTEFAESMAQLLLQVQDRALVNGPLAGVAFLFTASLVFAQIDRGFYRIWDVKRRGKEKGIRGAVRKAVSSRARSFAMIVAVCLLVIVLFVLGLGVRTLGELNTAKLDMIPQISKYLSLPLSVYGLIGSFLVVLVWIYFSVMVLFIGALIVRVEKKISRKKPV